MPHHLEIAAQAFLVAAADIGLIAVELENPLVLVGRFAPLAELFKTEGLVPEKFEWFTEVRGGSLRNPIRQRCQQHRQHNAPPPRLPCLQGCLPKTCPSSDAEPESCRDGV